MGTINSMNAFSRDHAHVWLNMTTDPWPTDEFHFRTSPFISTAPIFITFTFEADANAADRYIQLIYWNGTPRGPFASTKSAITANETVKLCFGDGLTDYESSDGKFKAVPLPRDIFFESSVGWDTLVVNRQANDQLRDFEILMKILMLE